MRVRRVAALLCAVLALALSACSRDESIRPPSAHADATGRHAEDAQVTLDRLLRALRDGSASAAEAVAAPGARGQLATVAANARALQLHDLALRYVDEGASLDDAAQARLGDGAWAGQVQLEYAVGGVDRQPVRLETEIDFVPHGDSVRVAGFGGPDVRTPLWLVDRLSVVRKGTTLTAVDGDTAGRYPRLVTRAVAQVRRTLPRWSGPLVVEVAGSQDEMDHALDAQAGEYDNIAAVTTSEDGSLAVGAPVRVFINPAVFERLKQRGAQVVMSHEATHVATGATFVSLPTWLMEGFADYVALNHAGVPVSLAAGQILPRIRKHGLPSGLPTSADLDPTANGLGATYEEAWLACRFLGERYGQSKMVAFYEAVSGGEKVTRAFSTVLGTTQRQFVAAWRQDLAQLAGVRDVAR